MSAYYDLTKEKNNIEELEIREAGSMNCKIVDKDGIQYDGFTLAKTPAKGWLTICECDFRYSDTDSKKHVRLIFRKTDQDFKDRNVSKGVDNVRIPFDRGKEGYREFWKMISFFYKFREILELDEFTDYFSVTDQNIGEVLENISKSENKESVVDALKKMDCDSLGELQNMVSTAKIDAILEIWESNKTNNQESFWHSVFKENSWILSQIFASQYIFVEDEFFCGGSRGNRKGGVLADFVYENQNTLNTSFVEIKTPETKLVNSTMVLGTNDTDNNAIYAISSDLTAAMNEVTNQSKLFQQKKDGLEESSKKTDNTKCIVVIGKVSDLSQGQLKSFELFRSRLNMIIITFDELFERISSLLQIFKSNTDGSEQN